MCQCIFMCRIWCMCVVCRLAGTGKLVRLVGSQGVENEDTGLCGSSSLASNTLPRSNVDGDPAGDATLSRPHRGSFPRNVTLKEYVSMSSDAPQDPAYEPLRDPADNVSCSSADSSEQAEAVVDDFPMPQDTDDRVQFVQSANNPDVFLGPRRSSYGPYGTVPVGRSGSLNSPQGGDGPQ